VTIKKRSALGLSGKTERIREMMMIGRWKIKKVRDDIELPCIGERRPSHAC
jgi:hypothetical protein